MNFAQYCRFVAKEADKARAADNAGMPLSSKEKQESFRARRAMLGMTEVRGIYLSPDLHPTLKAFAVRLQKRRERRSKASESAPV